MVRWGAVAECDVCFVPRLNFLSASHRLSDCCAGGFLQVPCVAAEEPPHCAMPGTGCAWWSVECGFKERHISRVEVKCKGKVVNVEWG